MSSLLPVLPDVSFVETDPQQIIADIISGYEQTAGYTLAEGDPRRLFLLSIAYIIIQQRQKIDASGKSNLLYYAQDGFIEHIGAMRQVLRLEPQPAKTTLRFTLSAVLGFSVGIPSGTRATADNNLYWRTTEPATIAAGQLFVDVAAEALTAGEIGNGLPVNSITRLVDPIPYVQFVANTTATTDGRNKESLEAYRNRIYLAPSGFSIAGPEEAYVFHALSASSAIVDVAAYSPSDGVVAIRPLLANGGIPNQTILDLVEAAVNPATIRPLTDKVEVSAPEIVNYSINLTYYIRRADGSSAQDIIARVNQAVADYDLWQKSRLGRDINPSELVARLMQAGIKRVASPMQPAYTPLEKFQVAIANSITVNYGGLEDD